MIIENTNIIESNRFNSNSLNTSGLTTIGFTNSTTGSGSSELLSNCDSSELDQPLNLANGFYNNLTKLNNLSSAEIDDDFDDEDNQNALDLSVKSAERNNATIEQLSALGLNNDTVTANQLNQLNEPNAEIIRNAITTLLALQSVMPKSINENQQLVAQANSLLNNQSTLNANMNLLAAAQNNTPAGSLLNLFNSFL